MGILLTHKYVGENAKYVGKRYPDVQNGVGKNVGRNASREAFPTPYQHGVGKGFPDAGRCVGIYGVGNKRKACRQHARNEVQALSKQAHPPPRPHIPLSIPARRLHALGSNMDCNHIWGSGSRGAKKNTSDYIGKLVRRRRGTTAREGGDGRQQNNGGRATKIATTSSPFLISLLGFGSVNYKTKTILKGFPDAVTWRREIPQNASGKGEFPTLIKRFSRRFMRRREKPLFPTSLPTHCSRRRE
ncbi:hypothetical protein E5676_scaffold150G00130 [Cucumis melo var. makuwa]|uniref:Uncharacterized protein n=1 Tax=Cucumis melo var. makuwa TaxID=1194695 RepID=A0A5A7UVI4_CUCMM|nr:hypothetical protein E6C27_scaffold430G00170 [Cucumis melo var. makuwa]TYK21615.1 hypothetical protein E5676_scaffold150G00130 [Cucumis melo var. makuwa]